MHRNREPAVRESFLRELQLLATLRHPNLIQMMGYCVNEDKGEGGMR
jgi:serine/threonine protein kinase